MVQELVNQSVLLNFLGFVFNLALALEFVLIFGDFCHTQLKVRRCRRYHGARACGSVGLTWFAITLLGCFVIFVIFLVIHTALLVLLVKETASLAERLDTSYFTDGKSLVDIGQQKGEKERNLHGGLFLWFVFRSRSNLWADEDEQADPNSELGRANLARRTSEAAKLRTGSCESGSAHIRSQRQHPATGPEQKTPQHSRPDFYTR